MFGVWELGVISNKTRVTRDRSIAGLGSRRVFQGWPLRTNVTDSTFTLELSPELMVR
jgi:hypothetical protein